MVRCSDAKFAAFRKRKTSKRVPQEAGATSGGEVPSTAPRVEPHISEAPAKTNATKGPKGAPQEAEARGVGAAEGSQPAGVVPKPEVAEATEAREEARREARGKRRVEEGPRVEGPTQKKSLASGPQWGRPGEVTEAGPRGSSSPVEVRTTVDAQSGVLERGSVEDYRLGPNPRASVGARARADVDKRESCLKDLGMFRRMARVTLLSRDHQFMNSLSIGDLMDQSMVNAIRISVKFP